MKYIVNQKIRGRGRLVKGGRGILSCSVLCGGISTWLILHQTDQGELRIGTFYSSTSRASLDQ